MFVDFTGLTVNQANLLRQKYREGEGEIKYQVVKNTLMTRALSGLPFEGAAEYLKGTPTGVVFGFDDPVAAAKATFDFVKENQKLKVKGGIVDRKPIDETQAEALSKMPGRTELIGQVISLALSPASNLISQIKSPAGRIVGAVEKKAEESAES